MVMITQISSTPVENSKDETNQFIEKELSELQIELEKIEKSVTDQSAEPSSGIGGSDETDDGISYGIHFQLPFQSAQSLRESLKDKIQEVKDAVVFKFREILWAMVTLSRLG